MQINGLSHAQAAQSLSGVQRNSAGGRAAPSDHAQSTQAADQLDLSAEAQLISQTQAADPSSQTEGIRWEKVNALRQAIAQGNYDSPERMSGALDSFLDAYA